MIRYLYLWIFHRKFLKWCAMVKLGVNIPDMSVLDDDDLDGIDELGGLYLVLTNLDWRSFRREFKKLKSKCNH